MSQTEKRGVPQKLVIRNKAPGTISSGANTEVLLDGKPVRGVSFIKVEVKPKKLTKVVLEMYCEVEVEADVELEPIPEDTQDLMKIGKHIYTVGKYETTGFGIPVKPKE